MTAKESTSGSSGYQLKPDPLACSAGLVLTVRLASPVIAALDGHLSVQRLNSEHARRPFFDMFGVVREFQPPLGVTHAVRGRFGTTSSSLAAVFARKNSLDVFLVRANVQSARLQLLCSTPLGAAVFSLSVVRRTAAPDLLCVGFDCMRVAILSWHTETRSWHTEQLIDLGNLLGSPSCTPESLAPGLDPKCKWRPLLRGATGSAPQPLIRSDPSGRCVAVLAKSQSLFYIVPIHADEDLAVDSERVANSSSIFTVDLPSEYEAPNVKDFAFLHGTFEPNIVVLYEQKRTWSGRAAVQRNTCSLLTFSIDLRSKRTSKQWTIDELPYDCEKLEPVPESARGGVLVISASVIMQVRHGSCVAGLSLNCFGDAYATELRGKYETIVQSDTLVECDAAHCRFLDVEETGADPPISSHQSIALLSLKGGELYFLHVAVDSRNIITMKRSGSTVIASEIVPINDRFFILSSRLSDSLLVEYKRVEDEEAVNNPEHGDLEPSDSNGSNPVAKSGKEKKATRKKRKRSAEEEAEYEMIYGGKLGPDSSDEESDKDDNEEEHTLKLRDDETEGTRGVYDDEDELGFVFKSDSGTSTNQGTGNWALTVKDNLPCFGPGADVTIGPSPKDPTKTHLDMVVAGGYAKNGCLAVVNQSVRPTFIYEFEMPDCNGIWTLLDPNVLRRQQKERANRNAVVLTRNEARKSRNAKAREARKQYLQEAVSQLRKQRMEGMSQRAKASVDPAGSPLDVSDTPFKESKSTEDERADCDMPEANLSKMANCQAEDIVPRMVDLSRSSEDTNKLSPGAEGGSAKGEQSSEEGKKDVDGDNNDSLVGKDSSMMKKGGNFGIANNDADMELYGGEGADVPGVDHSLPSTEEGLIGRDQVKNGHNGLDSNLNVDGNLFEKEKLPETADGRKGAIITDEFGMKAKNGGANSDILQAAKSASTNIETNSQDISNEDEAGVAEDVDRASADGQAETKNSPESPPRKRQKDEDGRAQSHDDLDDSHEGGNFEIDKEDMLQLRRQAEATFTLEDEEAIEADIEGEEHFHSYMLLSTTNGTTVMTTGVMLEEAMPGMIDFIVTEETITAGNVLRNHAMVQVVPSRVRVIMDGKLQCEFILREGEAKIKSAQVCDPLVLLERENNDITVLRVSAEAFTATVSLTEKETEPQGEIGIHKYGMAVSKGGSSAMSALGSLQEGINKTVTEIIESLRNFSLSVDFESKSLCSDKTTISCAYLYTGPLASEIASESASNLDNAPVEAEEQYSVQKADSTESPSVEVRPEDVPIIKEEIKKESERPEGDQMDDDERMLYGDDAGEEEDEMMLYGSGNAEPVPSDTNDVKSLSQEGTSTVGEQVSSARESTKKGTHAQSQVEKGVLFLEGREAMEGHGHLLVLVTANGVLHILSCDLKYATILACPFLYTSPPIVTDVFGYDNEGENKSSSTFPAAPPSYQIDTVVLTEVAASSHLPGYSSAFFIISLRSGLPLVYSAFIPPKPTTRSTKRSRLTLKRIEFRDATTRWFCRMMKRSLRKSEGGASNSGQSAAEAESLFAERIRATTFQNICGRSGLFMGGSCPAFLFAERGYPRIHEMGYLNTTGAAVSLDEFEDGQGIIGLAEFHNLKCVRGFVYVGNDHIVRIGVLPESGDMNYDAPTPFSKVSLRCTPHKVAYHGGSETYGVLASMPTLTRREERLARILQSLEKHDKRHYQHTAAQAEAETGDELGDRVPPLYEELHELRVYQPDNWNVIRSYKLETGEVGLAITNMKVDVYKQQMAGSGVEIPSSKKGDDGNESLFAASIKLRAKDVLVVGTGHLNGEDASSRGRLLLFEVSKQEVYTEAGGAYTAFQLQLIAQKELLSPVTSVAAMEGYVIAGVGPLISVYKLVGDEIVHLAFTFGQLYCTSMATLKQYIVVADMCKSVSFHYFRERNNSVNFLAQDHEMVTTYATEFLIENENVSVIISDGEGNLRLLSYAHASVAESQGGKRLLLNGGINVGTRINKFIRVRAPDGKASIGNGLAAKSAGRHALVFVTLDGGIGALVGATEQQFEVLQNVRKVVKNFGWIKRSGGIDMDELCAFRHEASSIEMLGQRLMDSRVIYDVFGVTIVEMRVIARRCGMNLRELVETLLPLEASMWRL